MADGTGYWFARRFPVGSQRNAMSPVTAEGFRVAWQFVWWMIGGAVAAIVVALVALMINPFVAFVGPVIFVACAIYGASMFIGALGKRGDNQHTVDDYKAGRVPRQRPYGK